MKKKLLVAVFITRRNSPHANIDDSSTYLTLVIGEECDGNIKRC